MIVTATQAQNDDKSVLIIGGGIAGLDAACKFFAQVDAILEKMDDSQPDESFLTFLQRRFPNPNRDPELEEARQHAIGYVTGFNAADPGVIGTHWLVQGMRAEEKIEGQRAFRSKNGYEDLLSAF